MKRLLFITLFIVTAILISGIRPARANDLRGLKTLGVYFNYNVPGSELNDNHKSEFSGGAKIGYGFTKELGSELAFSRAAFDNDSADMGNTSIDILSLALIYQFDTTTNMYPFFKLGVGYYMPDISGSGSMMGMGNGGGDRNDDDLGFNIGVGFINKLVDMNDMFALNVSGNYHQILNEGKDLSFIEVRFGIDFNFY